MESRREFSGSRKCEKCRQSEEVEMRQSDQTSHCVNPVTSSRRYTEYQKRYSKRREMMKLKVD